MSLKEIRKRFQLSPACQESFAELNASEAESRAKVFFAPHFTLSEALDLIPGLVDLPVNRIGVIFRPLNQPSLNRWVRKIRQRFGLRLLSRKEGFTEAGQILTDGGAVAILFDQNASGAGSLITFFGRICSATELPGLLSRRHNAKPHVVYPRRTGFWKATYEIHALQGESSIEPVIHAHRWLENYLSESADQCADWLWLHNRWRMRAGYRRLRLDIHRARRNHLETSCQVDGLTELPRKTPFLIRLPDNEKEVELAIPLLAAIRQGRPDVRILVLLGIVSPALETSGVADQIFVLPKSDSFRHQLLAEIRDHYPEIVILFTEDAASDKETVHLHAPQVFGLLRPGQYRPVLTHPWKIPASVQNLPTAKMWEEMARYYGLQVAVEPSSIPSTTS